MGSECVPLEKRRDGSGSPASGGKGLSADPPSHRWHCSPRIMSSNLQSRTSLVGVLEVLRVSVSLLVPATTPMAIGRVV